MSDPKAEAQRRKERRRLIKDITRLVLIVAFFAAIGFNPTVRAYLFDAQRFRELLHPDESVQDQFLSYAVFLAVTSFAIAIGFPRIWICAAAGTIYGAVLGTSLGMTASIIGAFGTYFIGAGVLKSTVKRRFGKRLTMWADRFRENAFFWTLYARLFPGANATVTSLLCGALRISPKDFLAANLIGFLPLSIAFAMFGSGAGKGNLTQIIPAGLLFALTIFGPIYYTLKQRAKGQASTAEEDDDGDDDARA